MKMFEHSCTVPYIYIYILGHFLKYLSYFFLNIFWAFFYHIFMCHRKIALHQVSEMENNKFLR